MEEKRYYRVNDLVKVLGCSRAYACALVKDNDFPAYRLGGRILIPADEFDAWLHKYKWNGKKEA